MNTSQDSLPGQWCALKGQVQQHWGKLTDDDVRRLHGTTDELAGALQQRYGYGNAQAKIEINQWVSGRDSAPVKI